MSWPGEAASSTWLRYFRSIQACLTAFGGREWIDVVHVTRTQPLDCLRIVALDRQQLDQATWD
ncbi:MAG: hypothetical protein ACRDOL_21215 [Streptosporangiaceae bacterium]